jgi:SAM-dependent methyltransferase
MTSAIERKEQELYSTVWDSVDAYGVHSPGANHVPIFRSMAESTGSVLDAGCGSGRAGLLLQDLGYRVVYCDFVSEGLDPRVPPTLFAKSALWKDLTRVTGFVDYTYCCDVMEHIPPELTMLVLYQLMRVSRKGLFLSISTVPDHFGQWVGESLHKTVQPFKWWRDHLKLFGTVLEARDLLTSAIFFVEPFPHVER